MKEINHSSIAKSIKDDDDLVIEGLSLNEFRSLYFYLKNTNLSLRWIAIFLGDEVVFQPLGRSTVLITLVKNGSDWKKNDVDFVDDRDVLMLGTVNGKYHMLSVVCEVFDISKVVVVIMIWLLFVVVGLLLMPVAVISKICEILITVMSIFISIFVVFSTVINPEEHFRFVEDNRFSKLTVTDKSICVLGVATIIISISGLGYGMVLEKSLIELGFSLQKMCLAAIFSTSIIGVLISFWMVTTYHFDRKNRLLEISMAKRLLRQIQSKYTLPDKDR